MKKSLDGREKVLDLLYQAQGEYLSGEELSNHLGVSRTTVWKYINYLREAGYKIESSSKVGYRLLSSGQDLVPEEIKRKLESTILGQEIIYFKDVASTNDIAKGKALKKAPEGTVIIAEAQSKGKGRLGRSFSSPQGGIWLSVILRPELKPVLATRITYIASLAAVKTIRKLTKLDAMIKWPNDILINDKKVSGILTEMDAELDQINFLVLGIGINLNFSLDQLDQELHTKVTTIYHETGKKVSRVLFIKDLLEELESLYLKLEDFEAIMKEWKNYAYTLGKEVKVESARGAFVGLAIDIAQDGALIVKSGEEIKKVYSGEVSLAHSQFNTGN